MPPGPPWKLVSPFGVLHIIEDRDALGTFIAAEELDTFNIKTIMRDLLARQCTLNAGAQHIRELTALYSSMIAADGNPTGGAQVM